MLWLRNPTACLLMHMLGLITMYIDSAIMAQQLHVTGKAGGVQQ